jgi:hypothetical protein
MFHRSHEKYLRTVLDYRAETTQSSSLHSKEEEAMASDEELQIDPQDNVRLGPTPCNLRHCGQTKLDGFGVSHHSRHQRGCRTNHGSMNGDDQGLASVEARIRGVDGGSAEGLRGAEEGSAGAVGGVEGGRAGGVAGGEGGSAVWERRQVQEG